MSATPSGSNMATTKWRAPFAMIMPGGFHAAIRAAIWYAKATAAAITLYYTFSNEQRRMGLVPGGASRLLRLLHAPSRSLGSNMFLSVDFTEPYRR